MNRLFDKIPLIGGRIPGKITLSFFMLLVSIHLKVMYNTYNRTLCVWAMFFSFLGDVLLNHKKNHSDQTRFDFVFGGIFFILAHICYCLVYGYKTIENNYILINKGFIGAITILLIITFLIIITSKSKGQKLLIFGIMYLWITGINYSTILSYAYSVKSIESFVAFGGLLFLLSDVIIGLERFSGLKSKIARELVWWFYPIGQLIIIAME